MTTKIKYRGYDIELFVDFCDTVSYFVVDRKTFRDLGEVATIDQAKAMIDDLVEAAEKAKAR